MAVGTAHDLFTADTDISEAGDIAGRGGSREDVARGAGTGLEEAGVTGSEKESMRVGVAGAFLELALA